LFHMTLTNGAKQWRSLKASPERLARDNERRRQRYAVRKQDPAFVAREKARKKAWRAGKGKRKALPGLPMSGVTYEFAGQETEYRGNPGTIRQMERQVRLACPHCRRAVTLLTNRYDTNGARLVKHM